MLDDMCTPLMRHQMRCDHPAQLPSGTTLHISATAAPQARLGPAPSHRCPECTRARPLASRQCCIGRPLTAHPRSCNAALPYLGRLSSLDMTPSRAQNGCKRRVTVAASTICVQRLQAQAQHAAKMPRHMPGRMCTACGHVNRVDGHPLAAPPPLRAAATTAAMCTSGSHVCPRMTSHVCIINQVCARGALCPTCARTGRSGHSAPRMSQQGIAQCLQASKSCFVTVSKRVEYVDLLCQAALHKL